MSDIEDGGIAEGAIAGGGAEGGGAAVVRGPELYGVSPGPPGFGPGVPTALPPDGLAGCADTGAENASAATIATPVKRRFISAILPLGPRLDMVERLGWLPLDRVSPHAFQMAIATVLREVRHDHRPLDGRGPCNWVPRAGTGAGSGAGIDPPDCSLESSCSFS